MTKFFKYFFVILALFGSLGLIGTYVNSFFNVAKAPAEIINKTINADNILHNYEWFYDYNAQYNSRIGQIQSQQTLMMYGALPVAERQRMIIDIQGMKHSCRELATQYNANSKKLNRSLFKSNSLPYELSMEACNPGN